MEIIALIGGILKFWDSVVWLIKKLENTPEEDRQKLVGKLKEEAEKYEKTGRPDWSGR